MAAQKGRNLLVKIGDGGGPEVFTAILSLNSTSFNLSQTGIETTTRDLSDETSEIWREMIGSGVKQGTISGSGIFKDIAAEASAQTDFSNGTIRNFQIVLPALGTWAGAFLITALSFSGTHEGEVTYDITMESAGDLTFTAA